MAEQRWGQPHGQSRAYGTISGHPQGRVKAQYSKPGKRLPAAIRHPEAWLPGVVLTPSAGLTSHSRAVGAVETDEDHPVTAGKGYHLSELAAARGAPAPSPAALVCSGCRNKAPRAAASDSRREFSHSFGGWSLRSGNQKSHAPPGRCWGESVPGLPPSFQWLVSDLWCSLTCQCIPGSLCRSVSKFLHFIRTPVILDEGPTLLWYDLVLANYIHNDSISKEGHILRSRGSGLQHRNSWRTQLNPEGWPLAETQKQAKQEVGKPYGEQEGLQVGLLRACAQGGRKQQTRSGHPVWLVMRAHTPFSGWS
nr:uncharacterized protein LOC116283918 [Vicugna pacos]